MPKKRVHEIAKEQGLTSKEVLAAFKEAGVYVKAASSTVEERDVRRAFPHCAPAKARPPEPAKEEKAAAPEQAEAPKEPAAADRDSDGKAKVPRAKATKRAKEAAAAEAKAELP